MFKRFFGCLQEGRTWWDQKVTWLLVSLNTTKCIGMQKKPIKLVGALTLMLKPLLCTISFISILGHVGNGFVYNNNIRLFLNRKRPFKKLSIWIIKKKIINFGPNLLKIVSRLMIWTLDHQVLTWNKITTFELF